MLAQNQVLLLYFRDLKLNSKPNKKMIFLKVKENYISNRKVLRSLSIKQDSLYFAFPIVFNNSIMRKKFHITK